MARPRDFLPSTPAQKETHARNLSQAEAYGSPRKVWVEDGHVFVEGYDSKIVSMTPEVAIDLGRTISEAGAESLINRVMEQSAEKARDDAAAAAGDGRARPS